MIYQLFDFLGSPEEENVKVADHDDAFVFDFLLRFAFQNIDLKSWSFFRRFMHEFEDRTCFWPGKKREGEKNTPVIRKKIPAKGNKRKPLTIFSISQSRL